LPLYRSQTRRTPPPEPAVLSREILERIDRVHDYHRASKHTYAAVQAAQQSAVLDWDNKPNVYRTFPGCPKTALPTTIVDASTPTLQLLTEGLGALPASQLQPPQNLKTLSTWLYLANGITIEKGVGSRRYSLRSCPSSGALYPFEIYVAAFGIDGLEPGLYHYGVREFSLRKLRGGPAALQHLKRGRPDLEFLKTVPAALLVSTNYWRLAWRYKQRAYRYALLDAGHLVQNLVSVGNGIGIQTNVRLRINDKTTRELIGVQDDCDFGECESVQALVVWADSATNPLALPARAPGPVERSIRDDDPLANSAGFARAGLPASAGGAPTGPADLPSIARSPLSPRCIPYGSIRGAHEDCVAPGVAIREIRPPLTELSPLPVGGTFVDIAPPEELPGGPSLRRVLMTRRSPHDFVRHSISRSQFWTINRVAFRGGSHSPTLPDGPHAGLVKPFWVLHDVGGMDNGVWYYDAAADRWAVCRRGGYRMETQYLCLEQPLCGNAAAVCFMVADLKALMTGAGPDAYRLAHLEAGVVAQRIHLAAASMELACAGSGAFYDDEVRGFLDLHRGTWEPIYAVSVGVPAPEPPPERPAALQRPPRAW
jgi:SagB-type dehydrogenase family enzyme